MYKVENDIKLDVSATYTRLNCSGADVINCVCNVGAGDVSRDLSSVLHVTLRLLRLSDEREPHRGRGHVPAAVPVPRLHAQAAEGSVLAVRCRVLGKHAAVPSAAHRCRPGQSSAYQHRHVDRTLSCRY